MKAQYALLGGTLLTFAGWTVQATQTVSSVAELTNAVAKATTSTNAGDRDIVLKPGTYDLSTLSTVCVTNSGKTMLSWGTACAPDACKTSWLVFNAAITFRGENTKDWRVKTREEESVIKGDGTARLLYPYTGAGRCSYFRHLTFEDGHTAGQGGAIYMMNTDYAKTVQMTNCVFRNCSSDVAGGATAYISAFGCLYENNSAAKGGAAIGGRGAPGYPTNTFANCVFRDNVSTSSTSGGGALYCDQFTGIRNCVFSNNTARACSGGALFINQIEEQARVENCTFVDNSASNEGGALYANSFLGGVVGCAFTNNVSQTAGAFCGGAGVGLVSNDVFVLNRTSSGSGGACYVRTRVDKMADCAFDGNSAHWSGGAFVANGTTIGELAHCTFRMNSAVVSAGALSIGTSQEMISDCVFEGNSTPANIGALYVGGKLTTLTNCTFVGNSAVTNYATLQVSSYGRITGCTFKDNVAGKMYAGVVVGDMASAGVLENCVFDNNTNSFQNIGSQIRYATQVTGCTFRGAGDMFAANYDRCVFDGCSFSFDNYGGGMIVFNTVTGAGHVRNCLFTNSTAHIYIKNDTGATVEISNCTFVDNDAIRVRNVGVATGVNLADGYLFYAFRGGTDPVVSGNLLPSTNLVVNCIFSNNKQNGTRNDVSFYRTNNKVSSYAGNILKNSLYEQVTSNDYFKVAIKSDLVVGTPKFVAGDTRYPDAPYYMIHRGSPAYNTGAVLDWMTADAVDLAGNARVVDGLPDMGCYECDLPVTATMLILR